MAISSIAMEEGGWCSREDRSNTPRGDD